MILAMTYTPEMYGLRRGKPGPGNDYYQASNKPPGALAAQCAHERSAADVQEWREQEFGARVDDIKRLKKRVSHYPFRHTSTRIDTRTEPGQEEWFRHGEALASHWPRFLGRRRGHECS